MDKVKECGFTVAGAACGAPYFEEAGLVLVCKKAYWQDMDPTHFLDGELDGKWYPEKDYHRIFIGEIVEGAEEKLTPGCRRGAEVYGKRDKASEKPGGAGGPERPLPVGRGKRRRHLPWRSWPICWRLRGACVGTVFQNATPPIPAPSSARQGG